MGIPRLETLSTSTNLKFGLKIRLNPDPVMRALFDESGLEQGLQDITRAARITDPSTR
jgi:hypothetical protein